MAVMGHRQHATSQPLLLPASSLVAIEDDTARLLERVPMFAGLTSTEMEELAKVAVPRSYDAGQVVFREGDQGDTCFVVKSGAVKITREHGGRTIALAELRAGDMFGELSMFGGEVRSATAQALEDTAAVALLAGDVRRLLAGNPTMALKMLEAMANRVRATNQRLANQSFQTVAGRVAGVLLQLVDARQAEGAAETDVLVETTQADIAQLAGASRESASRFLATLERQGLVTTQRGKVIVHDPGSLRNYIY
jgi:CRP/FNR family transcriptional regulator, cyclic AMP receptor protein